MRDEPWPQTRFVERRSVVAIVPYPQRDEPPGRGEVGHKEVVLASLERTVHPNDVEGAVRDVKSDG